jgi:type III pantothenate kinase
MNICVDVGNTMVKIGFFKEDKLLKSISFTTDEKKTDDEYFALIKQQMNINGIALDSELHVIYASVVPSINVHLISALTSLFNVEILVLSNGVKTGLPMKVDNPSEVGSDLIADVVGAKTKYGYPLLVADLGTATKILLVDKDGFFSSATLTPGISISADILSKKGEMLPSVSLLAPKKLVARNTIDAMNVGIVYGHAFMVSGLINKLEEELGYKCKKILTGGGAIHIKDIIEGDFIYDKGVCLDGLNIILNKNIRK